jgi:putative transposase
LHYRTYPNGYVNVGPYAQFLRTLLRRVSSPVVLVHDRGNMHRGDPMRDLERDFPRLDLNLLPPYAPELNPVEQLWNFVKDKELSNFVPRDVAEADAEVTTLMEQIRRDQIRLRTFYAATPLPWNPLTVFF